MAVDQKQIDLVLGKANIVDIVGKYLDIQKKGRNYLAVCPFHDDKDPSLHITPSKKIFKCFVCGVGGNVLTFVQEFNNITFFNALKIVAKEVKVTIDGLSNYSDKPRFNNAEARVIAINTEVAKFFNGMLITKNGQNAREYLQKRYIKKSEISRYQIGFAPNNLDVKKYLLNKGFEERDIENSKLFSSKGTKEWCFFENRVVFPIWDGDGNVIGFSGRAYLEGDEPKYKNSIENIVFKKSQLAYNFTNAINHIRVANEILILEGFLDVISLERIGIRNSVAIMGTSLSDFHVKIFNKVTKNFKLFLDGDKAGIRAALKTATFLMDRGINVSIIENKTQKDPDELVIAGNKNLIEEMIVNARHPIDFAIDYFAQEMNKEDLSSVANYIKNVISIIEHEQNGIIRTASINRLVGITNVPIEEISKLIKSTIKVEVVDPQETYHYENEDQENMWIPPMSDEEITDGFVFHESFTFTEQPTPQSEGVNDFHTVKLEMAKSTEQMNLFNERRKLAESMLLIDLIESPNNLDVIKDNLNILTNFSYKKVAEYVIDMYEKDDYAGNSINQVQEAIQNVKGLSVSPLFEMKNRLDYFHEDHQYSVSGMWDIINTIKLYRLWVKHNDTLHKLIETTDYQAKFILHDLCEEIMNEIRNIINLKEERKT